MEEFNVYKWKSKYLLKENLEAPIEEQPLEEEPVTEVEKNENLVDEIGEFWVVIKPEIDDKFKEDLFIECDIFDLINLVKTAGLKEKDIMGIYLKRGDASRRSNELIKQRDTNLKEMEGAMSAYRESKKEVDNKRNSAKELINKLK